MVDVTVFGGGIFGLSVAYACAARGAKVRLVEAGRIAAGSSGGLVGALAPHVPDAWNAKKQFQLDSLLMAEGFWAGVAARSGRDPGYARTGRLQPLADAAAVDLARARAAAAARHWGEAARWELVPAEGLADWLPATGLVLHDTLTARLSPWAAAAALVGALEALGVEIVVEAGTGERPDLAEGRVVWATGWQGLVALSAWFGQPLGEGVKGQTLSLRLEAADRPQIFAGGLHIVPHADGTVAIGSTTERDFADPFATDELCAALHARALAICPALEYAPVTDRWAGVRPRSRSRAPVLGEWPGRPGHFVANGGFKIGFGMAPKVAEVMADLLLDGRDAIPEGFRVADNLRG